MVSRWSRWWLALAIGLTWSGAAEAQPSMLENLFRPGGPPGASSGGGLDTWLLVRLTILAGTAVTAVLLSLYGLFPWLLRTRRNLWPKEAYGMALGAIVLIVGFVATGLFWGELVLTRLMPGLRATVGTGSIDHYALKILVPATAVAIAGCCRVLNRSDAKARLAGRGDAKPRPAPAS